MPQPPNTDDSIAAKLARIATLRAEVTRLQCEVARLGMQRTVMDMNADVIIAASTGGMA
jgi:hypothetical protein